MRILATILFLAAAVLGRADSTNATISVPAVSISPTVTLGWNASTTAPVDHYVVYQATSAGGPFTAVMKTTGTMVHLYVGPGDYWWRVTTAGWSATTAYAESDPSPTVHATLTLSAGQAPQTIARIPRVLRGRIRFH